MPLLFQDKFGHNILIHVGLGISGLSGEGIKLFKKIGDTVKKGEKNWYIR